jgi:predicted MFS family arabinose efflux permease
MRAFAGLGLATAIPSGFGIVGTTVRHEPARTIVFAMFGLGTPAGAFLGSLICGGLSTLNESGWSYFFFALAGVSAVVLALAWFVVPADAERRHGADKRVDWIGGVIVTAAICLLPFSLTDSGITPRGWSAPRK